MKNCASSPRKGRKFDQVLAGARKIFMQVGFEGASVDAIAREAGVSKATLYSYFPDKRLLFMEVARRECQLQAESARSFIVPEMDVRSFLETAARKMVATFCSSMSLSIYRVCSAEAERFPDLARAYYEAGPAVVKELLGNYLRAATERGELDVDDPELAAEQFAQLCRVDLFNRRLFAISPSVPEEDVERIAGSAVKTFLARYGKHEAVA